MGYKWCAVPACTSTTIKTPEKIFISVPKDAKVRQKWLQLARRDSREIKNNSVIFFCQDHFNIEKDIANYLQYTMGFSQVIILAEGVVPTKFDCQEDRRKRMSDAGTSRPAFVKRQRTKLLQECLESHFQDAVISEAGPSNIQPTSTDVQEVVLMRAVTHQTHDKSTSTEPVITSEKSTLCHFKEKVHFRSKAMQTKDIATKETAVSPFKHFVTSSFTSPFKIESSCDVNPSRSGKINVRKRIRFIEEASDSDASCYPDAPKQDSSSFVATSSSKVSDSGTNITDTKEDIDKIQSLRHTLRLIVKKPMMYVGVPKESYFIVHLIHKHTNIPHEHILLCLKKIRLNNTFSELEDNFGLSLSYASKLFLKNIPIIASVLHPFIVNIDSNLIKKTLPIAFRYKYYNVSCIIDCLEIDIQKPSNALFQAQTWSDYKKGNTVKFLISCTPNGLINYISPGFGGRASDVTVLQNCNFLDHLEADNVVLADRGFKHVESILSVKGIQLLRPPSVASGLKLSKAEVRQTKIMASLRIHIERVIRRIREFNMLKQHSVINQNFLRVLNDVIVIACALINLQGSLIK